VKIGRSPAELLHIFDFQNGGRLVRHLGFGMTSYWTTHDFNTSYKYKPGADVRMSMIFLWHICAGIRDYSKMNSESCVMENTLSQEELSTDDNR